MGWSSGSKICEEIWELIKYHIPDYRKTEVVEGLCDIFEEEDCDTLEEIEDKEFKIIFLKRLIRDMEKNKEDYYEGDIKLTKEILNLLE